MNRYLPLLAALALLGASLLPSAAFSQGAGQVSILDFAYSPPKGGDTAMVSGMIQSNVPDQTLSRIPLQINVFDPRGMLIRTDNALVTLDPAQERGFVGSVLVDSTQAVGSVTVQALSGSAGLPVSRPDLTIDTPLYKPGQYQNDHVQAVVHNNTEKDISQLLFDVVAFDSGGKVIGGGLAMVSVAAGSVALAEGAITTSSVPNHMEIDPNW